MSQAVFILVSFDLWAISLEQVFVKPVAAQVFVLLGGLKSALILSLTGLRAAVFVGNVIIDSEAAQIKDQYNRAGRI